MRGSSTDLGLLQVAPRCFDFAYGFIYRAVIPHDRARSCTALMVQSESPVLDSLAGCLGILRSMGPPHGWLSKIMVLFWVLHIIRRLIYRIYRVPKKGP